MPTACPAFASAERSRRLRAPGLAAARDRVTVMVRALQQDNALPGAAESGTTARQKGDPANEHSLVDSIRRKGRRITEDGPTFTAIVRTFCRCLHNKAS